MQWSFAMRLVFRSCALVASFLLALSFGAQAQEPSKQESIKIGVLLPFTGPLATTSGSFTQVAALVGAP